MQTKTDVSKYIVNVQGKDFITFPGLLQEAHAKGLKSINTELVSVDLSSPVVKATVVLVDNTTERTFTGYGDATANNVAKKVAGALLRMAETRAIARALRFACNIDMAALEELDAEENVINHQRNTTTSTAPKAPSAPVNRPPTTTTQAAPPVGQRSAPTYQSRPASQVVRPFQRPAVVTPKPAPVAATGNTTTTESTTPASNNVEDVEF